MDVSPLINRMRESSLIVLGFFTKSLYVELHMIETVVQKKYCLNQYYSENGSLQKSTVEPTPQFLSPSEKTNSKLS